MYLNEVINRGVLENESHSFMMSRLVINHVDVLKALHKLKPTQRVALLKTADKALVQCITECAYNILIGKVPLNSSQKSKLTRRKKVLRNLIKHSTGWKTKRNILVQKGGSILPLILGPLLSGVLKNLFT